jgi:hypothetical protein
MKNPLKLHKIYWNGRQHQHSEISYIIKIISGNIYDLTNFHNKIRVYPVHAGLNYVYSDIFYI